MIIFVFGSNLSGVHGAGAAKFALEHHGAIWGNGVGRQGNSYAIPTKNENIKSLSLAEIKKHVDDFIDYAKEHPELIFQVTAVGCGLAGFSHRQTAPLFQACPDNCLFDEMWHMYLPDAKFWGTF